MPLSVVQDRRARGKFKEWRDGMAANPREADYAWTVLARVISVAKDRGLIAVNVCERGGRLYEADRAEIIWLPEHITAFCSVASPELQFALLLALWTGQRQGTLTNIAWSQYDGSHIRLQPNKQRQGKKKKRIVIPVGAPLKIVLDARRPEKPEGTIRNTFGKAWTSDGFRASWGTAFGRAKLGDADLHFHDLRGTAVTRLALSGRTTPQIAAITGHSPRRRDSESALPWWPVGTCRTGHREAGCPIWLMSIYWQLQSRCISAEHQASWCPANHAKRSIGNLRRATATVILTDTLLKMPGISP